MPQFSWGSGRSQWQCLGVGALFLLLNACSAHSNQVQLISRPDCGPGTREQDERCAPPPLKRAPEPERPPRRDLIAPPVRPPLEPMPAQVATPQLAPFMQHATLDALASYQTDRSGLAPSHLVQGGDTELLTGLTQNAGTWYERPLGRCPFKPELVLRRHNEDRGDALVVSFTCASWGWQTERGTVYAPLNQAEKPLRQMAQRWFGVEPPRAWGAR